MQSTSYQKFLSETEVQRFRTRSSEVQNFIQLQRFSSASFRGFDSSEDGRLQRQTTSEAEYIRTSENV
ncbi:hypothetical protein A2U01_0052212 [Trifolium medium]|uniref:Uncharacterized protein n=1 Tax=Trifolium medium TaxID=97028 RepID=A0A392R347_9FABA|nr:hypothetical protein [Trifolium medium]